MIRKPKDEIDDPRREMLIRALSAGLFAATGTVGIIQPVWAMGKVPKVLIPGKSIYDMSGDVTVNGQQATMDTQIKANDVINTGHRSHLIFAVGKDAFILRSNSHLVLSGGGFIINTLRLVTGKLLSVFGKSKHRMYTPNATIGIRGTGIYIETDPEQSYVCTCYGVVDIYADNDRESRETIVSHHHNAPRYVLAKASPGKSIRPAPFINHTDLELQTIEALVGRTPPFLTTNGGGYTGPRNNNY